MKTSYTLSELAEYTGGQLKGQGDLVITNIASIDKAQTGEIAFLSDREYQSGLEKTQASAILLPEDNNCYVSIPDQILVEKPYHSAITIARLFEQLAHLTPGISSRAEVAASATVSNTASIGANCVIGERVTIGDHVQLQQGVYVADDCHIGKHTHIQANAVIERGTTIGDHSLIQPNAVIGSIGYGLDYQDGKWEFIPHLGSVLIGNNVSIGACSTIDRGSFSDTVIEDGVKIDNQVQIAHNVKIGAHSVIAGCVGIAGSCEIGSYCMIGGGVRFRDHVKLTDYVNITGSSVVGFSISEAGNYSNCTFNIEKSNRWFKKVLMFDRVEQIYKALRSSGQL